MSKYTGKLTKVASATQQVSGQARSSNVYISSNFSFKNAKVTQATAKQSFATLPEIKSVIKIVSPSADSSRVSDIQVNPAATPIRTIGIIPIANPPPPVVVAALTQTLASANQTNQTPISIPFSPITISSSLAPGESSIFGASSFIDIPINFEILEKTTGAELTKIEKPRVLAIISEDVRNGIPNKNIVIFKKLTSTRARIVKYTILRKNVFKDGNFKKVLELQTDEAGIPDKYKHFVDAVGYPKKDVFMYVDKDVQANNTYVYKIEVNWVSTGPAPTQSTASESINTFGIFGNLFASGSTR